MAFRVIGRVRFIGVVAAVVALILTSSVNAAVPQPPLHVGRTTSVVKDVRGQLTGRPERKLVKADRVFFNENIVTAGASVVVVQFRDGSTLELGPNGALVIDELVFNPFERTSRKRGGHPGAADPAGLGGDPDRPDDARGSIPRGRDPRLGRDDG